MRKCNNTDCTNEYSEQDLVRSLGPLSAVITTGHCSAACYTRTFMVDTPDNIEDIAIREVSLDLVSLEEERLKWSLETFPEATAESSILKLQQEINEVKDNLARGIRDPEEYVDCLMCILDSAGRNGIGPAELLKGYRSKLDKNKARTWVKNADNTYSHVKKVTNT